MSRVDEFANTSGTALITRIEWTDGEGTSWDSNFVPDPTNASRMTCTLNGSAGGRGAVQVTHADGTKSVYVCQVGQQVVWDGSRGTYTFPR
jgi:hypothetical protein